MAAIITNLRRYPLKGARSFCELSLTVNPTIGVTHDRIYGLRRRPGDLTRRSETLNKFEFVAGANTASISAESPTHRGNNFRIDPEYVTQLKEKYKSNEYLELQDTGGKYHLADTKGPQVSFLNLATLREFEKFTGTLIDPERFRMNVWIDNLPAFEELEWVDQFPGTREIMVGSVRMRVDDVSERCKAPDANPTTGVYDMNIRQALMRFMEPRDYRSPQRGVSTVMGFYGVVLNEGELKLGDRITLL